MAALLIVYATCSTDQQDLTAQRDGLTALGVADNRVYVDYADHRIMAPYRGESLDHEVLGGRPVRVWGQVGSA